MAAFLQGVSAKPQTSSLAYGSGLLQRKCACGSSKSPLGEMCDECQSGVLQRKLAIGASNDPLELEADRIAEQVWAMPPHPKATCARPRIQRVSQQLTGQSEPGPDSVSRTLAGPGSSLQPALRQDMEQRFGHDFSKVRVHVGTAAEESARDVGANAYVVGSNIVFGRGRFAPGTHDGRKLLAHELAHVVQQSGADGTHQRHGGSPAIQIQRELATPPPVTPQAAQPELTDAQIDRAIKFNQVRYDPASTRLIQDLVGTKPTGVWIKDDIVAIAALQEQYGFKKDGMIGPTFFRFLDEEIRREKLSRTDKNCLLAFRVIGSPQTVGPVTGGSRSITGHFEVRAQFSKYCGCAYYEYRQFIRGHWRRERGGITTDLGSTFTNFPGGGGLPTTFIEDGNTSEAALNYGHRTQPAETINHYLDDTGAVDQANGCIYEAEDTPGGPDSVLSGDVFDIDVNFRGEIQRKGAVVRTLHWTAIKGRFPVP